jgi:hypothetical protein
MRKLFKLLPMFIIVIALSGCSFYDSNADDVGMTAVEYSRNVGEEVPPLCIRGITYNRAESLETETNWKQHLSTGVQFVWKIISEVKGW